MVIKQFKELSQWLDHDFGLNPATQEKLLVTILVIIFLYILNFITVNIVVRRIQNTKLKYKWSKVVGYIIFIIGFLMVGRTWIVGFKSITTFLGLVSAGLAIALRDLITDIAGWFFILWKRPFKIGDRVQIMEDAGDVIDQDLFQFTILEIGNRIDAEQHTGRMIHIPNGKIFSESLANYSKGFEYIWHEIPITITFESNVDKTKKILEEIINEHTLHRAKLVEKEMKKAARKFMITLTEISPKVYTDIQDSGVRFTLRYLCKPSERRETIELISESVLKEFEKNDDIDLAYPTRRVYDLTKEKG